jgi:hypothetical protein
MSKQTKEMQQWQALINEAKQTRQAADLAGAVAYRLYLEGSTDGAHAQYLQVAQIQTAAVRMYTALLCRMPQAVYDRCDTTYTYPMQSTYQAAIEAAGISY